MKKGFTLAELIGALVILSALILILIPIVDKQVKEGKEELYNKQIESIKLSMELWVSDYQKPNNGETITITLAQLKQASLVDIDIKNPKTKKFFPNDMLLTITNREGLLEYDVLTNTGSNIEEFAQMPIITINGNTLDYVEIDSTGNTSYIEKGVIAKNSLGQTLSNVLTTTEPELAVTTLGTYLRTYTVTDDNKTMKVIKTIVVRDSIPPVITYSNRSLTIKLSQVPTYNFLSDVTVTDNSGVSSSQLNLQMEHNIGLIAGTYTVQYRATDASGNTTTKLRKVIVEAD